MEAMLVHPRDELLGIERSHLYGMRSCHVVAAPFYREAKIRYADVIPVFERDILEAQTGQCPVCIFNVNQSEISDLADMVGYLLLEKADRVIVNLHELDRGFDVDLYRKRLLEIVKWLILDLNKEVNLITDRIYMYAAESCRAGESSFVLSPRGGIYSCVGTMENGMDVPLGSLAEGGLHAEASRSYRKENHLICQHCDAFQCPDCSYWNLMETGDMRIACSVQCKKAHVEREISRLYQEATGIWGSGRIEYVEYIDPIERLLRIGL